MTSYQHSEADVAYLRQGAFVVMCHLEVCVLMMAHLSSLVLTCSTLFETLNLQAGEPIEAVQRVTRRKWQL